MILLLNQYKKKENLKLSADPTQKMWEPGIALLKVVNLNRSEITSIDWTVSRQV